MFEDILGSVNSARNSVQNALGVTNNSAGLGSFRGVSFYVPRATPNWRSSHRQARVSASR